jgi:tetratricopeptide (TPR) repeat protein
MLETIREFGRERLAASGREAAMQQRHAAWALTVAERAGPRVRGPEASGALEALERDHASVRAALTWLQESGDGEGLARLAGAIWPFWKEHAHYAEGRRWLETALELGRDAPAKDRLRVMSGAATLAWYQADAAYARQMHERALALAREIGDRASEAFVLGGLAVYASELGDYEQANARFEESLAVAREVGDPEPVVLALHNLAHQEWERGQPARALSWLEEALTVAREHHMGWILPSVLVGLGTVATDLEDPVRAMTYFRESLVFAQERGNLGDVIDGIGGVARLEATTGEAEEATRLFGAADAWREELAMPFSPREQAAIAAITDGLRATLGEDRFAEAWTAGQSLSRDEVLAEALAQPETNLLHAPQSSG